MTRAWLSAFVVMSVGAALYLAAVKTDSGVFVIYAIYLATPTCGALIAAYISPQHKFKVGAATVVLAAVVPGIANFIFGEIGNASDLPGAQGSFMVAVLSLPVVAVPCIIGALAGEWLSKRKADA